MPNIENILLIINTVLVIVLFYLNWKVGRTSVYPFISVKMRYEDEKVIIELVNQGEVFAVDVDVLIIGHIALDEKDNIKKLKESLKNKLNRKFKYGLPTGDKDDWIGVYDRLTYGVFPKDRIQAPLHIPKYIEQFDVIIQYRSPNGTNFGQDYWFTSGSGDRLHLAALHPKKLKSTFRRDFIMAKTLRDAWPRKTFRHIIRPYSIRVIYNYLLIRIRPSYIGRPLIKTFTKHSISGGMMNEYFIDRSDTVEDRGTWG